MGGGVGILVEGRDPANVFESSVGAYALGHGAGRKAVGRGGSAARPGRAAEQGEGPVLAVDQLLVDLVVEKGLEGDVGGHVRQGQPRQHERDDGYEQPRP